MKLQMSISRFTTIERYSVALITFASSPFAKTDWRHTTSPSSTPQQPSATGYETAVRSCYRRPSRCKAGRSIPARSTCATPPRRTGGAGRSLSIPSRAADLGLPVQHHASQLRLRQATSRVRSLRTALIGRYTADRRNPTAHGLSAIASGQSAVLARSAGTERQTSPEP